MRLDARGTVTWLANGVPVRHSACILVALPYFLFVHSGFCGLISSAAIGTFRLCLTRHHRRYDIGARAALSSFNLHRVGQQNQLNCNCDVSRFRIPKMREHEIARAVVSHVKTKHRYRLTTTRGSEI